MKHPMKRSERRRANRTYSSVPLDVYDPKHRVLIGEARFVNVSLRGSLLESRYPLKLHQTVFMQVQAPTRSPFEFAGEVVWRKKKAAGFTYGIQFQSPSKARAVSTSLSYKKVA